MPTMAQSRTEEPDRPTRSGFGAFATPALGLGALAALVAAIALVWSTMTTASARFVGSTTNDSSLLEAAVVDLVVEPDASGAATTLLVDADGLYPGLEVERCVRLTYRGTLDDAVVRLFGSSGAGSGLERYLDTSIELGAGDDPDCADFQPARAAFSDTLDRLWGQHGSFANGLEIMASAADGDSVTLRFAVEVVPDNAAQDLTTRFGITLEARP